MNQQKILNDNVLFQIQNEYIKSIPDLDDNFTIDIIIKKILITDRQYDIDKIITAYKFASKAHDGQKRSSGQNYIIHPLAVAYILIELGMDTDTICSALLHDVIEDTSTTLNELKKIFGHDVVILVDGVTKLSKIHTHSKEQQQAENIRKILLAMSQDIRVMIIKLADRLHNMRTLKYRPNVKQRATSLETMNIYAPIAQRLGIRSIQEELEDLSFRYLDPFAYSELENILMSCKDKREKFIKSIKNRILTRFNKENFVEPPSISVRVKSIYNIYKKVFLFSNNINEIYDKYTVSIIVSTVSECYSALGLIHNMFHHLPTHFKDYIASPKSNSYQSLNTTVLDKNGISFEVQIRTWSMHKIAEYGIAANWKYKDGILRQSKKKMHHKLAWLRQVIETQKTSDDVEEIIHTIKTDLAPEDIVVMTPKGMYIDLPINSTVIDFAYRIHTKIGHKTIGAKVNGRRVSLDYKLQNGQICNIITTKNPKKGPNRAWLNIVKTNDARSKIRSWFKRERRDENIIEGKAEIDRLFKLHNINIPNEELLNFLQSDFNYKTIEDFYASIGYKGTSIEKILQNLKDKYKHLYGNHKLETSTQNINSHIGNPKTGKINIFLDHIQINNAAIKFAKCCKPLPVDDIVGFITTRGCKISIHTTQCNNYRRAINRNDSVEMKYWVDIQWARESINSLYLQTSFEVVAIDSVGFVYNITAVLMESKVPIIHSLSRVLKNGNAIFECTIIISSMDQLTNIFKNINNLKGIISVKRSNK